MSIKNPKVGDTVFFVTGTRPHTNGVRSGHVVAVLGEQVCLSASTEVLAGRELVHAYKRQLYRSAEYAWRDALQEHVRESAARHAEALRKLKSAQAYVDQTAEDLADDKALLASIIKEGVK